MKAPRTKLLAILGVLIPLGLLVASCSSEAAPKVGTAAPDFTLPTLDGNTISLSDFRGQPILINFWATWCGPCRYEMPFLQAVHEQARDEGLVVLAIDIGEGATTVRKFMDELKLTLTVPMDQQGVVATKYKVVVKGAIVAIPTSFLIDRNGIIRFKKVGAFANEAELWSALNTIMRTEG